MENYFLSLIIPVYKVEKYLNQCVDSVIKQNIKDIEIILVDDGSPDNSGKICDEYADKYDYIKVIHKENGGLSSARNAGLKIANGEYIAFMDSDDWWNEKVNVREIINNICQNKGVEIFASRRIYYTEGEGYSLKTNAEPIKIKKNDIKEYYRNLVSGENLGVSACTKFIKRDFLISNNLFFKEGICSEDCEWTIRVLRKVKTISFIDDFIYVYRQNREGSITNSITIKNIENSLGIVKSSLDYYKENNSSVKKEELGYACYLWFMALGLSSKLSKQDIKKAKILFKETKEVIKYSNTNKTKKSKLVYKLFGFNITLKVLGGYLNKRKKSRIKCEN